MDPENHEGRMYHPTTKAEELKILHQEEDLHQASNYYEDTQVLENTSKAIKLI